MASAEVHDPTQIEQQKWQALPPYLGLPGLQEEVNFIFTDFVSHPVAGDTRNYVYKVKENDSWNRGSVGLQERSKHDQASLQHFVGVFLAPREEDISTSGFHGQDRDVGQLISQEPDEQTNVLPTSLAIPQVFWSMQIASELVNEVRLALENGAHATARQLATWGARRFPHDQELQKMATILAPPEIIDNALPPVPSAAANQDWLRINAVDYRGQWVALRDGQLLAAGSSLLEMRRLLGSADAVMFAKVF